jgi:hypothetical protein
MVSTRTALRVDFLITLNLQREAQRVKATTNGEVRNESVTALRAFYINPVTLGPGVGPESVSRGRSRLVITMS